MAFCCKKFKFNIKLQNKYRTKLKKFLELWVADPYFSTFLLFLFKVRERRWIKKQKWCFDIKREKVKKSFEQKSEIHFFQQLAKFQFARNPPKEFVNIYSFWKYDENWRIQIIESLKNSFEIKLFGLRNRRLIHSEKNIEKWFFSDRDKDMIRVTTCLWERNWP